MFLPKNLDVPQHLIAYVQVCRNRKHLFDVPLSLEGINGWAYHDFENCKKSSPRLTLTSRHMFISNILFKFIICSYTQNFYLDGVVNVNSTYSFSVPLIFRNDITYVLF
ncbi:hypothetical protein ABFS83_07G084900 [Erythranthe nasuta]